MGLTDFGTSFAKSNYYQSAMPNQTQVAVFARLMAWGEAQTGAGRRMPRFEGDARDFRYCESV